MAVEWVAELTGQAGEAANGWKVRDLQSEQRYFDDKHHHLPKGKRSRVVDHWRGEQIVVSVGGQQFAVEHVQLEVLVVEVLKSPREVEQLLVEEDHLVKVGPCERLLQRQHEGLPIRGGVVAHT